MDSITKMVGIIETALLSIEEVTEPSPIDMLYALQDRLEAAEADNEKLLLAHALARSETFVLTKKLDKSEADLLSVREALAETLKARCDALEAENERLRAWAVAAYNARQPITDAALRMVLNVEADSDMTAGQRREGE